MTNKQRCNWVPNNDPLYINYHDSEWGLPSHDDQYLFEMICLEGMQAGLSWRVILTKREALRKAFYNYNPEICADLTDAYLNKQLHNAEIVRNKPKIFVVRKNARAFLKLQQQFGSFDKYLWNFTNGQQICNNPKTNVDTPSQSQLSIEFAQDLKKRGFSFVGPVTMYAYLQAVGVINDHTQDCFLAQKS